MFFFLFEFLYCLCNCLLKLSCDLFHVSFKNILGSVCTAWVEPTGTASWPSTPVGIRVLLSSGTQIWVWDLSLTSQTNLEGLLKHKVLMLGTTLRFCSVGVVMEEKHQVLRLWSIHNFGGKMRTIARRPHFRLLKEVEERSSITCDFSGGEYVQPSTYLARRFAASHEEQALLLVLTFSFWYF